MLFNTTRQPRSGKRERLTVGAAAVSPTASAYTIQPSGAANQAHKNDILPTAAVLQVFTSAIYWTIDGSTPSSTVGFDSGVGDYIYLDSFQKLKNFKAIRQAAPDGAVEILPLYGV